MHFFNLSSLKNDIVEGKLRDTENFRYLLATFIVLYLASMPGLTDSSSMAGLGAYLVYILINVFGLWRCFVANGGTNGTDFLPRFFSLGWVLGLRGLTCLIPFFFISLLIIGLFISSDASQTAGVEMASEYYWYVLFGIYQVWYYSALSFHMRDVRRTKS